MNRIFRCLLLALIVGLVLLGKTSWEHMLGMAKNVFGVGSPKFQYLVDIGFASKVDH